jgi:hypothetical protein
LAVFAILLLVKLFPFKGTKLFLIIIAITGAIFVSLAGHYGGNIIYHNQPSSGLDDSHDDDGFFNMDDDQ